MTSLTEQLLEARHELARRSVWYARWVGDEHLTPALAQRRLAAQRAIVATLTRLVAAEAWAQGQGQTTPVCQS
ncbi:MAG TPA: hypothetical protein VF077_12365 [Nitrospiraceae bacterium]